MYAFPVVLLILLAIAAVAWSPVFAVIAVALLFVAFLAYIGLRPRADESIEPPTGSAGEYADDSPTGTRGEAQP